MNQRGPPGAAPADTLSLFHSETAWARTRVLDAQAIETCDFDLDAFARFRHPRILTYSASVRMLHTALERFAESRVECVLGDSWVVSNVASIIALQTAAIGQIIGVLRGLPELSRDDVLKRVRDGHLHVRGVVEGHPRRSRRRSSETAPSWSWLRWRFSANRTASRLRANQTTRTGSPMIG